MVNFLGILSGTNKPILPIEQVGTRGAEGVQRTGQNPFSGAVTTGVDSIPTESMEYLNNATSGSVYKNGLGHSEFGKMRPYWA